MLFFLVDLINIEIFRISFSFFYSFSFILRSRATSPRLGCLCVCVIILFYFIFLLFPVCSVSIVTCALYRQCFPIVIFYFYALLLYVDIGGMVRLFSVAVIAEGLKTMK